MAIGVGVAELPISWPIVLGSALGLALASAMWWAYFDVSALLGERALADEPLATRARFGRNAYSYVHMPLMIGIVLVALGLKKALEYVGDSEKHTLADPLSAVSLAALVGGVVIYLLAHVSSSGSPCTPCPICAWRLPALLLAAYPLILQIPAMAQLAVVMVLLVACLIVEAVVYAESRRQIRAELDPPLAPVRSRHRCAGIAAGAWMLII